MAGNLGGQSGVLKKQFRWNSNMAGSLDGFGGVCQKNSPGGAKAGRIRALRAPARKVLYKAAGSVHARPLTNLLGEKN
jgi:hypothetical protein